MAQTCRQKVRYATKEFAEQVIAGDRTTREHPVRAAAHHAYWCARHNAWHTGHGERRWRGSHDPTTESIGRLQSLQALCLADYGAAPSPEIWRGVRALKQAIRYLQTHP